MNSLSAIHYLTYHVNAYVRNQFPSIQNLFNLIDLHIGEYKWTCRNNDYYGWLLCDGRSLPRTEYSSLFEVIGTSFGSDDDDTFKLPDFRGRVMGAICEGGEGTGLSARVLGDYVGEETHTLSVEEMPAHYHTGFTEQDGVHNHIATNSLAGEHSHGGKTGAGGSHTHTTNATGGTIGLVTADGQNTATNNVDSMGTNELNLYQAPTALNITGVSNHDHIINAAPDHTHNITVANSTSHRHAFTTSTNGSGAAHNNMQPTLFGGNVFIFTGVVLDNRPLVG